MHLHVELRVYSPLFSIEFYIVHYDMSAATVKPLIYLLIWI